MAIATGDMLKRTQLALGALERRGIDSDVKEKLHGALIGLQRLFEDMQKHEGLIAVDPRLTFEGRKERLATVAQQHVGKLSWLGTLLKEAEQAQDRLERLLFTTAERPKGNEVLQFLREQEIRQAFKDKRQSEKDLAYGQAVERGDEETVRALLDAPGGPWVSAELREQVAQYQAKRKNPSGFQKLADLKTLRQELGTLAEQTAQWLKGLGADPSNHAAVVSKSVAA